MNVLPRLAGRHGPRAHVHQGVIATVGGVLLVAVACKPDLGAPPSLIEGPRMLAVIADPPEAKPGATVALHTVAVDPQGPLGAPVAYTACRHPKPPSESNAVARSCLEDPDEAAPITGETTWTLAPDACTLFGPLTPPSPPGQPPFRPRDPDATGGYYAPIRARFAGLGPNGTDLVAFALLRASCGLANAPVEAVQVFNRRYTANRAPQIESFTLTAPDGTATVMAGDAVGEAGTTAPAAKAVSVPADAPITLRVAWPQDAAEIFPVFDLPSQTLIDKRESIHVSWFATAGEMLHDRSGREADDQTPFADNVWQSPPVNEPTMVHLWIVVRDARGAASIGAITLSVTP